MEFITNQVETKKITLAEYLFEPILIHSEDRPFDSKSVFNYYGQNWCEWPNI